MREDTVRGIGLSLVVCYAAFIGWLYVRQPQTVADVTGGLSASVGLRVVLLPPPLFALVLSLILFGALVRCGVFVPGRLMGEPRSALANANGLVVMLGVFLASAQAFSLATPEAGVPQVLFNVLLRRIVLALFEGVTLGTFTQEVLHPANGYLAFGTLLLFVGGLALLPSAGSRPGQADQKYLGPV